MAETWKAVVGYEGLYEVSDAGRVRSLPRNTTSGKILKPTPRTKGHLAVSLHNMGRKSVAVHKLVLEAFVGPAPVGMECCHNDGIPSNNVLSNLRWGTKSSNALDQVKHGVHNMASKTHCINGHEYTNENTYHIRTGGRMCKTCNGWRVK
jgi:hypothetical protein